MTAPRTPRAPVNLPQTLISSPLTDDDLVGEFRAELDRLLTGTSSAEHDLYPLMRALSSLRRAPLREALIQGASRPVDEFLASEWGPGLFLSLQETWDLWEHCCRELLTVLKDRRFRTEHNKWDPAKPSDGNPMLAQVLSAAMLDRHLASAQAEGFFCAGRYEKARWTGFPPDKLPRSACAASLRMFLQMPPTWPGSEDYSYLVCNTGWDWRPVADSATGEILAIRLRIQWDGRSKQPWNISSTRRTHLVFEEPAGGQLPREQGSHAVAMKRSRSGFLPPGWARALTFLPDPTLCRNDLIPSPSRGWREGALRHVRDLEAT